MKLYGVTIDIKIIAIGLLIGYIIFLQQCSGDKSDCPDVIGSTTDTTLITHIDTIIFRDTIVHEINVPIGVPRFVDRVVRDTIRVGDSTIAIKYPRNEYVSPYSDSLIEGTITITTDGYLVDQRLSYTPKFPKYIYRIDSVIIDNTTILQHNRNAVYAGMEVGGNNDHFDLSPRITLSTKKGFNYSYRYGLVSKTHNVGIDVKIQFKKWLKRKD